MHRNGGDAEFLARAQNTQCDLAAVGYEDFVKHWVLGKRANSKWRVANGFSLLPFAIRHSHLLDNYQRFAEFDRLAVFDENLRDGARARGWDLVHLLHGFADHNGLAHPHPGADSVKWF